MKKIILLIIAVILMLPCAAQADVIMTNYPYPDHLKLAICHDGGEGVKEVTIYYFWRGPPFTNTTITTTTTGIPYKWAEGPVVPDKVMIPFWIQDFQVFRFQVRVSSEDINGNVWAAGNYTGKVNFNINGKTVPVPVNLWIANCTDGPPQYYVPEFPVSPRLPVPYISAGIIAAMLGIVMLIRWGKH